VLFYGKQAIGFYLQNQEGDFITIQISHSKGQPLFQNIFLIIKKPKPLQPAEFSSRVYKKSKKKADYNEWSREV
jgi:hypothetical protein